MKKLVMREFYKTGRKWYVYFRNGKVDGIETVDSNNKNFRCCGWGLSRYGKEEWRSDIPQIKNREEMLWMVAVLQAVGKYVGETEVCDYI